MVESNLQTLQKKTVDRTISELERRVRNLERLFNQPIDAARLVNITAAKIDLESGTSTGSPVQVMTSTSATDVTGSSITTSNFSESKKVFAIGFFNFINAPVNPSLDAGGAVLLDLVIDGTPRSTGQSAILYSVSGSGSDGATQMGMTLFELATLGTGTHTIKLQARLVSPTNMKTTVIGFDVVYMVMGV